MSERISCDGRRLLGAAASSLAAAGVGRIAAAPHSSFGAVKQVNAGLLSVGDAEAGPATGTPVVLLHGWPYDIHSQYYFATERGRLGYSKNWYDSDWHFDDATYDRTVASFRNPDQVSIVTHNYRWRLSLANGEPRYDELEDKLSRAPVITVPTITIASDFDGPLADGARYVKQFPARHVHRILKGIGHNVPQEAPDAFAKAVVEANAL